MTSRAVPTRRIPTTPGLPPCVSRGVNALGDVFYRDEYFPLDYRHGNVRLEAALGLHSNLVDRLGEGLAQAHLRDAAYLDIETTGLSGGASTYAFLVGVGTFEGFAFRVRQFFLASPSGEPAMLTALNETIERCQAIVTFNGRSFDVPQMAARYALSCLPCAAEGLPHIDLLHPARKLFGKVLESRRLGEIERRLLGVRRFHDVSGEVIPALYHAYLKRARVRGLDPIFEHNSLDVISLVAFVAYLDGVAGATVELPPDVHLGLGRWDELRGRLASAEEQYNLAWRTDSSDDDGGEAVWRLARLIRRAGDWRRCLALWEEERQATQAETRHVRALIELAKLYEHRLRCGEPALALANMALECVQNAPHATYARTRPQLERRISRLQERYGSLDAT
jgi:uncharacterized protein YprB with RNaseH-like and TPR domain